MRRYFRNNLMRPTPYDWVFVALLATGAISLQLYGRYSAPRTASPGVIIGGEGPASTQSALALRFDGPFHSFTVEYRSLSDVLKEASAWWRRENVTTSDGDEDPGTFPNEGAIRSVSEAIAREYSQSLVVLQYYATTATPSESTQLPDKSPENRAWVTSAISEEVVIARFSILSGFPIRQRHFSGVCKVVLSDDGTIRTYISPIGDIGYARAFDYQWPVDQEALTNLGGSLSLLHLSLNTFLCTLSVACPLYCARMCVYAAIQSRRVRSGRCPECGYPATPSLQRCSECGKQL